jgi:hypothetical protein
VQGVDPRAEAELAVVGKVGAGIQERGGAHRVSLAERLRDLGRAVLGAVVEAAHGDARRRRREMGYTRLHDRRCGRAPQPRASGSILEAAYPSPTRFTSLSGSGSVSYAESCMLSLKRTSAAAPEVGECTF